jgi:myo-inositol 2-dehydrogenase/D-chiro-inositol 1-dehydrogenase
MNFNVALFGSGRIGRVHASNVIQHPELTLARVVDADSAAADALARATGARIGDAADVFADASIHGVIIATPTETHLELMRRAQVAGMAIFCEKPVDLDLARARAALIELDSPRILVGFNRRFDANFKILKAQLATKALGSLESLQIISNDPGPPPVSYIRSSGGLFKDMTIHDFDMARFLVDEEFESLFAMGSCLVDPKIGEAGDIDTARVLLKTVSGRLCVIANSRRSGFGYDQRIEAFCSGGLVRADNTTESTVQTWTESGAKADRFQNFFLERYAAAYRAEIAHFADIMAGKSPSLVSFADGVAALALADAAARSAGSGLPVLLQGRTANES